MIPNIEKKAMVFEKWLSEKVPSVNLAFNNFDVFLEGREKMLIERLNSELRK